jgi:glyoxylase-like metal-dependent hydrolase (beta-lactamase superfamily II)
MITLTGGIAYTDLHFEGHAHVIASAVLTGKGGVAIVDPGPSSTLPTLRAALGAAGITPGDITDIVLTHIHLDHGGATGTLVKEQPQLRVWVHELGAPHLIAPDRLIASATRLWGSDMDRLWGEVRPVPPASITVLRGGERIEAGGRRWEVAYTPGHASHHVSFFDRDSGIAFVGDAAGIRMPGGGALPPTPPPDIDLELWGETLARIEAWGAETLFVTHFGPHSPSGAHLTEMRANLTLVAGLVKASLTRDGSDEDRAAWFAEELRRELQRRAGAAAAGYEFAGRFDLNWRGLARYWRKRESRV